MKRVEPYIHTRNYGCRVRQYIMDGVRMLSLENQKIRVVLALDKGADIVDFLYKKTDTDVLWHSFNPIKNVNQHSTLTDPEGPFNDLYAGGWQELFPTYSTVSNYDGAGIGFHGEATIYPWDCVVEEDTPECVRVHLSVRMVRTPFLLEKWLTLKEEDGTLYIKQKATNVGMKTQNFMWGHHPAYGFPFLDESVRLHLEGEPTVTIEPNEGFACPFTEKTEGKFPYLPDKDGNLIDMSRAYAMDKKWYMEYCIRDLKEGKYELVNHNTGLGVRMQWDTKVFPYLWVWAEFGAGQDYPWYGRCYEMAVELWSTLPPNYAVAKEAGAVHTLNAGESMETEVSATLFEWEE
ncbi:MAG: DUF4432 family protein [Oscillospiraceae bacterium]|nr:DUF4432 family protein [Oscillospiraceae bacterium]